jgi:2,4-dienoyl-CoA reductase-like NADH-dependent reductase (Old Yellow Enzyme family)
MAPVTEPLVLPCGKVVPNRFVKSAMTECLASPLDHLPTKKHNRLYETWAKSGVGMIISGNVMVDPLHKESPRNVALYFDVPGEGKEKPDCLSSSRRRAFISLASSITSHNNTMAVMQLSHPGRQCPVSVTYKPLAPSAIPVTLPVFGPLLSRVLFRNPRALTNTQILEVSSGRRRGGWVEPKLTLPCRS